MKQRVKQPWYLHICSSVAVNGTTALECPSMPPSEISTVFGSDAVDCPVRPPSETLLLPSFCKSIWHEKLYELPFPFLRQNLYTEATIKTPKKQRTSGKFDQEDTALTLLWWHKNINYVYLTLWCSISFLYFSSMKKQSTEILFELNINAFSCMLLYKHPINTFLKALTVSAWDFHCSAQNIAWTNLSDIAKYRIRSNFL